MIGVDESLQPRVPRDNGVWRVERALAGFRGGSDRSEQAPARSRQLLGELPVSDGELEHVVREYRHVHEDHRRAPHRSRARRHLEVRLQELRSRFEHLLAMAPMSEADRQRWRDELRTATAAPPSLPDTRPLLFRGRSDSRSELRLTTALKGTVDAFIDGTAVAVLDDAEELTTTKPGFVFALDGLRFRETFGASPASLTDLRDALQTGRRPRRKHVRDLIADGLIDRTLGLTTRGRRALALDALPARHVEVGTTPAISTRGPVPKRARVNLARVLTHVARVAPRPVVRITASLTRSEDPARDRPVLAKATIALNGCAVRAHVRAASESEAIALLESRLHRNLRKLGDRRQERPTSAS
jgi:ribosome-associated translation inhibitor RaiA